MEAKNYPFWGVQFHPEKNPYEWTQKYKEIPHSKHAIIAAAYFADFFVEQTRLSFHKFESRELEEKNLIYSFSPRFTGNQDVDFIMQESYFF